MCLKAPETRIWAPEGALDRISYIKGTKNDFSFNFSLFFRWIFQIFRAVNLNFPSFFAGPGPGPGGDQARARARGLRRRMENVFFFSTGFSSRMGPKKAKINRFFAIFSALFPNIWPLAGPNIAKKGWPLQKLARVDRQTHFGTFNLCVEPGF